jgi:hypothetical protein
MEHGRTCLLQTPQFEDGAAAELMKELAASSQS